MWQDNNHRAQGGTSTNNDTKTGRPLGVCVERYGTKRTSENQEVCVTVGSILLRLEQFGLPSSFVWFPPSFPFVLIKIFPILFMLHLSPAIPDSLRKRSILTKVSRADI